MQLNGSGQFCDVLEGRSNLIAPCSFFFFFFGGGGGGGSRDGAVVRALASHCGPGSIPELGAICGLSLSLVLVLPPRGFFPGSPVFPSPQKPTLQNSNSILKVSPISALR